VIDGGALCEAFRLHRGLLAAVAGRILGRADDVDDVLQDAFVEALRGVHNLREPTALRAWLTRVTIRAAHRKHARACRDVGIDEAPAAAEVADPRASAHELALLRAVGDVMAAIPVERRRAWDLRTLDGEPLGDIAARCGCSRTTVKRRIAEVQGILDAAL
jgi:RNA polymerase sigma-70 factor (ECF subfamily)